MTAARIKTVLHRWSQQLGVFSSRLRCRPNQQAAAFEKKLAERDRKIQRLKLQLAQAWADLPKLRQQASELPARFDAVLKKSDVQLRAELRFCVQISEDGASWEAVTEHCCLGGCDMGIYTFRSEREALLFATLLQAAGYRSHHNIACPVCYAEYQKDCI